MNDLTAFHALQAFRTGVYQRLGARRDALFEALDAATTVGPVPSLPYLSLTALHRRGLRGHGQRIAVIELGETFLRSDLDAFTSCFGFPRARTRIHGPERR